MAYSSRHSVTRNKININLLIKKIIYYTHKVFVIYQNHSHKYYIDSDEEDESELVT